MHKILQGNFSKNNIFDFLKAKKEHMTKVTHFMRRPHPAAFSIERLYNDVRHHLPSDISVNICINQSFSSGLLHRIHDIFRVRNYQNEVDHITGDVHYLTYLLDRDRTILTIHDCEMLNRSRGFKHFLLWLFWFWLPEKRVSRIVVVSKETQIQIIQQRKKL